MLICPLLFLGLTQLCLPFSDRKRVVHSDVWSDNFHSDQKALHDIVQEDIAYDYGKKLGGRRWDPMRKLGWLNSSCL